jgi:hypothetical protein
MNAGEMSERILSILEEFAYENIFAMMNTSIKPTGAPVEIELFSSAMLTLIHDG